MEIISQHKSKVLPRIDVKAKVSHLDGVTPSNDHVKDELAKHFKCDKELVHVEHIFTNYGSGESKIVAYVYNDKKQMNSIITKSSKQREAEKKLLEESKKAPVAEAS